MNRRVAEAAELLHPAYCLVLVQPARVVVSREDWLATLPDYRVHEYTLQERVVDQDGDLCAILQRVQMRATVRGQDRSGTFVISDLWRHTGERWLVWRRHSTPINPLHMPGRR